MVAFRGTDLNTTSRSGQADACAGRLLWDGDGDLPAYCKAFSVHRLDYLSRGRDFVAQVRHQLPDWDLLLTGHSLGAGLASALAAADYHTKTAEVNRAAEGEAEPPQITRKAFVFSSPGTKWVLQNRTTIDLARIDRREIVIVVRNLNLT